jgi:CheY-like chemotaxis protein
LARKILLADDSVTAQNMGRRILSDAGYEVITVNNGSAALKKIAEIVPDLIVLDVYMPGYGGLEVCQRLKESQATARIPVLLTVGKLEPFKVEEARRVRADGHIVKPFDSTELLAAIIKLEDKIVPQPALTKQGRSAKASGSLEASSPRRGRDKSADPGSETTSGWKKRLSIPRNGPVPDAPSDAEETKLKTASTTFHDFTSSENQKPAEAKLPDAPIAIAAAPETPSDVESPSSARPFENFTVERLVAMEASAPAAEVPTLLQEVETKPEPTVSEVPAVEMKLPEAVTPETPVVEAPAVMQWRLNRRPLQNQIPRRANGRRARTRSRRLLLHFLRLMKSRSSMRVPKIHLLPPSPRPQRQWALYVEDRDGLRSRSRYLMAIRI